MQVILARQFKVSQTREVWKVLKLNRNREEHKRGLQRNVLTKFRKQRLFVHFKQWRETANKMREVSQKDTVRGAQIQLDEFKQRLAVFDVALRQIQASKLDRAQLESQQSSQRGTNSEVCRDMASLFDVSVQKIHSRVDELQKRITQERAFCNERASRELQQKLDRLICEQEDRDART